MRAEKEAFDIERQSLTKQIAGAKANNNADVILKLEDRLHEVEKSSSSFQDSIQSLQVNYDQSLFNQGASFRRVSFRGPVSFSEVAFDSRVDFRGSRFSGPASFADTMFQDPPDFRSSQMKGAHLGGADLTGADLSEIIFDRSTRFPKGIGATGSR